MSSREPPGWAAIEGLALVLSVLAVGLWALGTLWFDVLGNRYLPGQHDHLGDREIHWHEAPPPQWRGPPGEVGW